MTKDLTPAAESAADKISLSTKDLSPEDRKMLRGIFLHSFNVFTIYAGGARAGASGFMWACYRAFLQDAGRAYRRDEASFYLV